MKKQFVILHLVGFVVVCPWLDKKAETKTISMQKRRPTRFCETRGHCNCCMMNCSIVEYEKAVCDMAFGWFHHCLHLTKMIAFTTLKLLLFPSSILLFFLVAYFILLSRESDQCAIRARLGVAGHLSTTPRWENLAKCFSYGTTSILYK